MLDSLRDEIQILSGRVEETEHLLKESMTNLEHSENMEESKLEDGERELERIKEATSLNRDRILRLEQYLNFESSGQFARKKNMRQMISWKPIRSFKVIDIHPKTCPP